jgi:hypothetical protein
MASTYSSSLRLELMGNGDQSGTWGSTLNTNLGTLLEQGISGVQTITMAADANYTLTTANGASDEARNMVIIITSSVALTTTRTVTIPSVKKLYVVKNSTSGAQTINLKTAAGAAFPITNGSIFFVYCDGTTIAEASPADTAVTQTAGNSTTKVATTAFVTTADNLKANLASPTFTGVPAAPTAAAATNTTQLATTAFVTTADNLKANLAGPTFTGVPAAPTAADGTNTTQLATTAFVCNGFWESAEQTITNNTTITVAHGLGRVPQDVRVFIRCKTTEFGYAVGDEVEFNIGNNTSGSTYNHNPSVMANATNVVVRVSQDVAVIGLSTGNNTAITNANWRIVFRAR